MANSTWGEITTAKVENRHEIVFTGPAISKRIEETGIDPALFELTGINYLNISETCLSVLPAEIGMLQNLTNLVLHTNKLTALPVSIGQLKKLKMLDVSRNKLTAIPDEIQNLTELTTLNVSANEITKTPCFKTNTKLILLDASINKLEEFPDICYAELKQLLEVKIDGNQIKIIPVSAANLTGLRIIDISNNCLSVVPAELTDNSKLKEISLKGNKLSDKRLMKLVDQCKPKQILDYIRQHGPRNVDNASSGGGGKKGKKGRNKQTSESDINEVLTHKLNILHITDKVPNIVLEEDKVKNVRPHIVACILRDLNFTPEKLRAFIQLQTRLHDTLCQKRQLATIATHDLALLPPGNIHYTARPPARIKLIPLGQDKEVTAVELFKKLQAEAEEDKNAHSLSGVHRYLSLLDGKDVYPCVRSSKKQVISLPPITNSEISKISENTKDILVEVTSSNNQAACKTVLNELISETLELGVGDDADNTSGYHKLTVEQVKVITPEGSLKVVYPSRVDLQIEESKNVTILRE